MKPSKNRPLSRAERLFFGPVPIRVLIPNLLTLLVLTAGLTSIRFAMEGRFSHAVVAIVFAAFLDGLDGRVARLLNGVSRFGAELDSLADFVSFGCGPALIIYFWDLAQLKTFGWLAVLSVAFATALRLARFNVTEEDIGRPAWMRGFFVGVPAPLGAILALLPMNLFLIGVPKIAGYSILLAFYQLFVAFLMISRIPTFSMKRRIGPVVPRRRVIPIVAMVVLISALMISHTFETISFLSILYLFSLPLSFRQYKRQLRLFAEGRVAQEIERPS